MATAPPQYLYLLAEDLYRLGNSKDPRLENVRPADVDIYERNGILMVRATGLGVSLSTLEYLQSLGMTGWVWKVPTSAALPTGLALRPDPNPRKQGHYFLCPASDMTMDKYKSLLSELALRCERTRKL